jgi:hypothetical protein
MTDRDSGPPRNRAAISWGRTALGRSAHVDPFCRDHLPPAQLWPELVFDLPELSYPDRLNAALALLGAC